MRIYLRLLEWKQVLLKIAKIVEVEPGEIPLESEFILEMVSDTLYQSHFERQS